MFRFKQDPSEGPQRVSSRVSYARIIFSTIRLYEYTEYRSIALLYFLTRIIWVVMLEFSIENFSEDNPQKLSHRELFPGIVFDFSKLYVRNRSHWSSNLSTALLRGYMRFHCKFHTCNGPNSCSKYKIVSQIILSGIFI